MKVLLLVVSLIIGIDINLALAQFKGEIVGSGGQKFPIAVSPLRNIGNSTSDVGRFSTGIADSIVHDLELSGWFRVIDRSSYIESPQKSGITLGTFDLKDWSTLGAEGLVKGGFSVQGDEIVVELRLFDVGLANSAVLLINSSTRSSTSSPAFPVFSIPKSPMFRIAAVASRKYITHTLMVVRNAR
jgi:TolB-like protein